MTDTCKEKTTHPFPFHFSIVFDLRKIPVPYPVACHLYVCDYLKILLKQRSYARQRMKAPADVSQGEVVTWRGSPAKPLRFDRFCQSPTLPCI